MGEKKEVAGHTFVGFGGHHDNYHCNYLTAAATVGMTTKDVDTFIKRLDKVLAKCYGRTNNPSSKENDDSLINLENTSLKAKDEKSAKTEHSKEVCGDNL